MEPAALTTPSETSLTPPDKRGRTPRSIPALYGQTPVADAINAIETAAGGRQPLIAALAAAADDDDLAAVVGAIADPQNDARALSRICAEHSIPIGTVLEAFKRGVMAEAFVKAQVIIAAGTPAVVADVMERGAPHQMTCDVCRGVGTVTGKKADDPPVVCETCRGVGTLLAYPDLDRQKLALELGGYLKKGPGLVIDQRQQVVLPAAQPGSFAALQQATDQVLYRRRGTMTPAKGEPADTPTATATGVTVIEGEVTA